MVPGELVEGVDGGDVVAGHPTDVARLVLYLTPLAALVVTQDGHLLSCTHTKHNAIYRL